MKRTLLPTHAFINKAKLLKYLLLPVILLVMISCTTSLKAQDINFNVKSFRGGYNVSCNGSADGSIEALVIGGTKPFTYLWNTGATTQAIANIAAGHYSLTVTDAAGQVVSKSVTLLEPDLLDVFLYPSKFEGGYNISKTGNSDGSIKTDIKGGTPPYKILWNTGSKKEFLDNLIAGTYSVTITDQNNCTVIKSITLLEPTPLQIVSVTASNHNGYGVSCADSKDGSVTLVVSGAMPPYRFFWSNGSFDQNPTNLPAGDYKFIVLDANKVEVGGFITLTRPPRIERKLVLSNYPNGYPISCSGCANASITTIVTGGAPPYTYLWEGKGSINGQTTANLSNLGSGEYYVEITDANGCKVSDKTYFSDPPRDDWSLTGNNLNSSQYLGSNNTAPLVFKTANSTRMVIDANGTLQVNNLAGANNRILQTDANGILSPLTMGTANQVILGDGTLGTLPAADLWSATGTDAFFNAGKVGIGTSTPQYPLEVVGDAVVNGSLLASNLKLGTPGNNFQINTLALPSGGSIAAFGTSPKVIVECADEVQAGNFQTNRLMVINSVNNTVVDVKNDGINGYIDFGAPLSPIKSVNSNRGLKINSYCHSNTSINEGGGDVFLCKSTTGSVGIGTDLSSNTFNGIDNYFKLSVNGAIRARDLIVQIGWSDFVFADNYKRMPLFEKEAYYKNKKHLPYIQSGKEIETNGLQVGSTMNGMMQNIEENTLDVVDLYKKVLQIVKENADLKQRIETLENHKN